MNQLIGVISNRSTKVFKTRWFYVNRSENECRDVTQELYDAIQAYNEKAESSPVYQTKIPYTLKNNLTEYGFGCGLSHYLQTRLFDSIYEAGGHHLSFDLRNCTLQMYTKSDLRPILGCTSVWDDTLQEALLTC